MVGVIITIVFCHSFIFALVSWCCCSARPDNFTLGLPNEAKPTGLFINNISLLAASISNIKNKRVDYNIFQKEVPHF